MERIRNHREKPFTMVSNDPINNLELSTAAIGLYAKIQRNLDRPNYKLTKSAMRKEIKEGENVFDRLWAELQEKGYLKKTCVRKNGKFNYEYELYEVGEPDQAAEYKNSELLEMEKELKALRKEVESLRRYKKRTELNSSSVTEPEKQYQDKSVQASDNKQFTVPRFSCDGYLGSNNINNTVNNTINTPNPQKGTCEGEEKQRHSKYESVMEPLEEYLPEEIQKDGKHVRRLGSKLKDLATENRVSFLTAATRIFEESNTDIASPLAYYSKILDNIIDDPKKADPKNNQKSTKKQPTFCDFEQRNYDYDELLKQISQKG